MKLSNKEICTFIERVHLQADAFVNVASAIKAWNRRTNND